MTHVPSLTQLLEARARSASTMLIHNGQAVSFAQILADSQRVASGLRELGVAAGDRVAIWLPTTPAWLATLLGCARIGAIAVAVNTRYVARELADIVGRSGAKVMVYWPGFGKVDFAAILAGCPRDQMPSLMHVVAYGEPDDTVRSPSNAWPVIAYTSWLDRPPLTQELSNVDSPCVIWTTSGTSKAPKFVLHSQRSLVGHAQDVVKAHGLDETSVLLMAPPICGAFGFCLAMAMLTAGRPMVTAPVWDPVQAAVWVDHFQVTHLHGVDDAFAALLEQNDRTPAFPSLRFGGYGAFNPAQKNMVERADQRGLCLVGMYGTSEIQGLFSRQSEQADASDRALGGGRAVSSLARVRARNTESGEILPHGEPGELEIYAPTSRMLGYFENPEATAAAFTDDGFYRTGDLGYSQPDGRFVYLSRTADTLRLGGFLVSPREIESVLQEIAGIDGCQVVDVIVKGAPRPLAFIRVADGFKVDEPALIAYCADRLARYKVPCRVIALDAFPVTDGTNGIKVQKNRLRDMAPSYVT